MPVLFFTGFTDANLQSSIELAKHPKIRIQRLKSGVYGSEIPDEFILYFADILGSLVTLFKTGLARSNVKEGLGLMGG